MSSSVILMPGAPVLVPELSGAAAAESAIQVDVLRGLIRDAARSASRIVVLGSDPEERKLADVSSSLTRWGADVRVGRPGDPPVPHADVPEAALLAWWLLDLAGTELPRSFIGVARDSGSVPPVGEDDLVVVVADGPASLTARAPIPEDPRGVALDAQLAAWLRAGGELPDPGAETADAIGWWSRPAWLALSELVAGRAAGDTLSWAPFGVGYHGARWYPVGVGTDEMAGLDSADADEAGARSEGSI